eukprot:TRINITY_DN1565_c0_g1_i2.p1 TRINITY_DN1565_c0_g1~~TRINITY_DN1565_c0_g1_i2.p1  ORF type:complete len:533 (+),score=108.41 TRINITY_DN1565_c0_g1_i2:81-1679(+)
MCIRDRFETARLNAKLHEFKTLQTSSNPSEFLYEKLEFLDTVLRDKIPLSDQWRQTDLERLKRALEDSRQDLSAALEADYGRLTENTQLLEVDVCIDEVQDAVKNFKYWIKEPIDTPLNLLGSSAYRLHEPLGVVLIVGSWTEPVRSVFSPLIAAVAAGNHVVVVPPLGAPQGTREAVIRSLARFADAQRIRVADKASTVEEVEALIGERLNYVYGQGEASVVERLARAAGKAGVPYSFITEGFNVAVVDKSANVARAAEQLSWARFVNGGAQSAIAPDVVFVHERVFDDFVMRTRLQIEALKEESKGSFPSRFVDEQLFRKAVESAKGAGTTPQSILRVTGNVLEPFIISEEANAHAKITGREKIRGPLMIIAKVTNLDAAMREVEQRADLLNVYLFAGIEKLDQRVAKLRASRVSVNEITPQELNAFGERSGRGPLNNGEGNGRNGFKMFSFGKNVFVGGRRWIGNEKWYRLPFRHENVLRVRGLRVLQGIKVKNFYYGGLGVVAALYLTLARQRRLILAEAIQAPRSLY